MIAGEMNDPSYGAEVGRMIRTVGNIVNFNMMVLKEDKEAQIRDLSASRESASEIFHVLRAEAILSIASSPSATVLL